MHGRLREGYSYLYRVECRFSIVSPRRLCDVVCLVRVQVSVMTGSGSSLQPDTQSLN